MPDRLLWLREDCGELTQREASKLCGVGWGHIGKLERGEYPQPRTSTLLPICELYGVTMDWALRGIGKQPSVKAVRASIAVARARKDAAA